jgi:hypothetical protein
LTFEAIDPSLSRAEVILSNTFQDTDIVTFILHSVVNLWGYSIVNNGKKVRVRAGDSEELIIERGEILEEEKELFSKSKLNDKGERVYIFDDMPDDEFSADQVGENFVFDISTKYLGQSLDACDELFETEFEGYTFSKSKPEKEIESNNISIQNQKTKNPWWKIW